MAENEIGSVVLETAVAVHRELGPGLLETVYEVALADVLAERGLAVRRQAPVPIRYRGRTFDEGFRADLIVESPRGAEVGGACPPRPQETAVDVPPSARTEARVPAQFRRGGHEDRYHAVRERTVKTGPLRSLRSLRETFVRKAVSIPVERVQT